ncbi:transformer-2 protein homolog beta-like [Schistocerca gregaria]|uniref:transformer-2 protein homolog beta-like n=1 Tax=Schistocerca gregaria TaxID=7010 RepID=UPI00211E7630|nr:transformer-2 protein homolog beta-like [Schistocerca gregaria]
MEDENQRGERDSRSYECSPSPPSMSYRRGSRSPEHSRDRHRTLTPDRHSRGSPEGRYARSPSYSRWKESSYRRDRYDRRDRSPPGYYSSYHGRSRSNSQDRHYPRESRSRIRSPMPTPPSSVLAVFNLPRRDVYNILWDEINHHVPIQRLSLITDKRSGEYRGYAFITFASIEDATKAKSILHGKNVDGRTARADFSNTPEPHQSTPGRYMGRRSPARYRYRDHPYRR